MQKPVDIRAEFLSETTMREKLPSHGQCFVCGDDNPGGMGLTFFRDGDTIRTDFQYTQCQQGPPRHAHGGSIAAVLDEAMGAAAWHAGYPAVAVHLEIDFEEMVPLDRDVHVVASVDRRERRKVYTRSELFDDAGTLLARGCGIFLVLKPEVLEEFSQEMG